MRLTVAIAAAGLCVTLFGCQGTMMTGQGVVPDRNAELVQYITDQAYITAEPAYRAVYVLAKGDALEGEFDELSATLAADGLIGKSWDYAPQRCLTRADVGFMICRACRIRTGVNWTLTGLGRYAWRELIYHEIANGGDENRLMSGGEFVGILLRAEEYLTRTHQHERPPIELGAGTG